MIKISLPKGIDGKKRAYKLWEDLKLTGNMLIKETDNGCEIRLDTENKVPLSAIKKKLPKEAVVEEVKTMKANIDKKEGVMDE